MKTQNHAHFKEAQIIKAVIDDRDLTEEEEKHLFECPTCKRKVVQFKDELQEFGQKAREAVPPFSQPVKLPPEKASITTHNTGWLPFFGAAAMVSLVVFFYFMGMTTTPPTQLTTLQNQESLFEDEALMQEISDMVDNPLYEELYDLTGENGVGFEEDFLRFVVPDIQDDFQSEINILGGTKRC